MLAVLCQMWLYDIYYERTLLCFPYFVLFWLWIVWWFCHLTDFFFFFLVPGGLELAKHGHNWHHLMSVTVLALSGRLDDLQRFFPTIISMIHHVLVIHFLCIKGVLNFICFLWLLKLAMVGEVIFCCSTAGWDTQETQTPLSGRECLVQMACVVIKNLSPPVVGAWSFPQGRILAHSQSWGRSKKLFLQINFSDWKASHFVHRCVSLVRWINSRQEEKKLPNWRAVVAVELSSLGFLLCYASCNVDKAVELFETGRCDLDPWYLFIKKFAEL